MLLKGVVEEGFLTNLQVGLGLFCSGFDGRMVEKNKSFGTKNSVARVVVSFFFTPIPGKMIQFDLRAYFSDGLVQPATSWLLGIGCVVHQL